MVYQQDQLKKLQQTELEVLKEIIRVCDENHLRYFAVYGTLLGAVRHQGFIPWDDDIDIGMPREDYEKFLRLAPGCLKKGYTLQHFSVDPNAPAYFAKVRKDGTKFLEKNLRHLPIHHGIFVDVIPFDEVPGDAEEYRAYCRKASFWMQMYVSKSLWTTADHVVPSKCKRWMVNGIRTILHIALLPISKKAIFRKLDRELRRYQNQRTGILSERGRIARTGREEDYFPVRKLPFEDISICVPNHYKVILKKVYRDYMALPPVEKRRSHSPLELSFSKDTGEAD